MVYVYEYNFALPTTSSFLEQIRFPERRSVLTPGPTCKAYPCMNLELIAVAKTGAIFQAIKKWKE